MRQTEARIETGIHNVIFTTTVPCKHGLSTRAETSTDATMKCDGTTDEMTKILKSNPQVC